MALQRFEATLAQTSFPKESQYSTLYIYGKYNNKINFHFLEGSFEEAIPLIPDVLNGIVQHADQLDQHHIMVLYYKIACIYFGAGNFKNVLSI